MQADLPGDNRQIPDHRLDDQLLSRLACPACHGTLRAEADTILCTACGRRYPIVNGIPVLIPDRATGQGDFHERAETDQGVHRHSTGTEAR